MDSSDAAGAHVALAALVLALVKRLAEGFATAPRWSTHPGRCSTRTAGWRLVTGSRPSCSTRPAVARVAFVRSPPSCWRSCGRTPRELGCADELEGVEDLLRAGNGALRQQMVFEANRDLHELMGEIVERTAPQAG